MLPYRSDDDRIEGVVITFFDITERADAEEALRISRERYLRLFESIDDGLCILEPEGSPPALHVTDANPAFRTKLGLASVRGRPLRELLPDDAEALQTLHAEVHRSEASQRLERTMGADERIFEVHAFPTGDDGDRIALLFRDITDGKLVERSIRQNERRLTSELDAMKRLHTLVARLVACEDPRDAMEEVLAATMEISGATMGSVLLVDPTSGGLRVVARQGFGPEVADELAAAAARPGSAGARAIASKERALILDVEADEAYRLLRPLAARVGYRGVQATPLVGRSGEVFGVITTHHAAPFHPTETDLRFLDLYARPAIDHLERARSEAFIRASEARFRAMFEVTGVAAYELDASEGRILEVNETFAEMLGATRQALVGRTGLSLTHPDDRARAERGFQRLLTGSLETYTTEQRYLREDGSSFWGLLTLSRVPGPHRDSCVGLMFDVTRRREVERTLEEASRRKDDYLAMLGHELRNPLAAIRNAVELARGATPSDPGLERAHEVLDRQSRHMIRMIDDLVDISRIVRGKVRLEKRPTDLRGVVDAVLRDRAAPIEGEGLQLVAELPGEPLWVLGDATRLTQIVDNLVGNAIKFTAPPGTITVSLREETSGLAVLRIRDTGEGMRAEVLESIFEAIHQESSSTLGPSSGMGLGLAVAKGLVDLHDGTIAAHSAGPGEGTEMIVRLSTSNLRERGEEPAAGETETPRSVRILLVEDNPDTAMMLAQLLELQGHRVTVARQARRGLDILREAGAEVVLCDIGLPDMSGHDLSRAIRADPTLSEVKLVALTGYGQAKDRERALEAGFDTHLTKPVAIATLQRVLAELVGPARASG